MSFKDWVPVTEDIYDALMSRGPKQDCKLKITHELIAAFMAHHNIAITKKMEKPHSKEETTLVHIIRTQVEYCNLAMPILVTDSSNFNKASRLSSNDKSEIAAAPHPVKCGWTLQLAHVMYDVFGNPEYFTDEETTNKYDESVYGFDPKTINTSKANNDIKRLIDDCRNGKISGNQLVEALIAAAGNHSEYISAERAQDLENKGLVQRGYIGLSYPMTALMGMRVFGDNDSLTAMNSFIQVTKGLSMCIEPSDLTKEVKHIFNEIVKLAYSATSTIVENKSKSIVDDE